MVIWAFVVSNKSLSVINGVSVAFTVAVLCSLPLLLYSISDNSWPDSAIFEANGQFCCINWKLD